MTEIDLSPAALSLIETRAKAVTLFATDGREEADDGSIEWQSMSPTTFATYERRTDRDWYRDAPDLVLALTKALRAAQGLAKNASWCSNCRTVYSSDETGCPSCGGEGGVTVEELADAFDRVATTARATECYDIDECVQHIEHWLEVAFAKDEEEAR